MRYLQLVDQPSRGWARMLSRDKSCCCEHGAGGTADRGSRTWGPYGYPSTFPGGPPSASTSAEKYRPAELGMSYAS
jgi:hypothetical protein